MQRRSSRSALVVAGVIAAAGLAFALRSLGFETTFLPDGSVAFHFTDANYHARRALWTMLNFPRVLAIDPYLNYPHGATVPWPPLLDWLVAAVSLVLGGSVRVFERVAAWTPPLLGALAVLPIYGLGRLMRGPGVGIGAALIFACLPLVVQYGQVGNYDHHAAMAPLGGLLLLCYASALDERTRGPALLAALLGLVASRIALMLVWQGNLLYLGPCELAFTGLAVVARRRDLLGAQALGALFTSAAIAPLVSGGGPLIGGPWSAIELSRLHVTAFVCISVVSGGLLALDRLRPAKSGGAELRRALWISALLGGLLLVLPGPREGLQSAFDFVTRADEYGATNLENQRLFLGTGKLGHLRALQQVALYAYLVPVAALALLWEARRRRESRHALLLLALWAGLLGAMALTQRRYMNDFAPVGCAAFALLLAQVGDLLRERRIGPDWLPRLAPPVLGVALLLPAFPTHVAALRQTLARSGADAVGADRAAETAKGALLRFGQAVREATPATASLYGPGPPPEYSILGFVGIGHVLHYVAERPTPADNFGPYIGRENFRTVLDYFLLADEEEALEGTWQGPGSAGARRVLRGARRRRRPGALRRT